MQEMWCFQVFLILFLCQNYTMMAKKKKSRDSAFDKRSHGKFSRIHECYWAMMAAFSSIL